MSIQNLLGINSAQKTSSLIYRNIDANFVKKSFNYGNANPLKPNTIVHQNALGDPPKGTHLYLLG